MNDVSVTLDFSQSMPGRAPEEEMLKSEMQDTADITASKSLQVPFLSLNPFRVWCVCPLGYITAQTHQPS
jgi:hypothetical protein